eukprot:CAMPEP_0178936174 /NCGR_PEP_ID=MMETSP0786-20121207/25021_1 /TAXON_ID=186022 /ORGANISM="Thalassionema frauenfeldii, Strain CCMP 1798" /LENGTH=160 /DNA_ID=CAMNT_0020614537 /DNA_START=110 /DNA_END=589 /DNA_ORIENTATION=-
MIPSEISNLTNLKRLWLNDNQLSGSIPFSFCEMDTDITIEVDCEEVVCYCCKYPKCTQYNMPTKSPFPSSSPTTSPQPSTSKLPSLSQWPSSSPTNSQGPSLFPSSSIEPSTRLAPPDPCPLVPEGGCSICGEGKCVRNPEAMVFDYDTCNSLELLGYNG